MRRMLIDSLNILRLRLFPVRHSFKTLIIRSGSLLSLFSNYYGYCIPRAAWQIEVLSEFRALSIVAAEKTISKILKLSERLVKKSSDQGKDRNRNLGSRYIEDGSERSRKFLSLLIMILVSNENERTITIKEIVERAAMFTYQDIKAPIGIVVDFRWRTPGHLFCCAALSYLEEGREFNLLNNLKLLTFSLGPS